MAGGDGSQAVVAAVPAAHDLPFVCVPAGTRYHFGLLDLGVDRDDVVGSLDAYGAARQARIDLGDVNGQVFVNNVSLGVYGRIVASDEYRDAKLRQRSPGCCRRCSDPTRCRRRGYTCACRTARSSRTRKS